jgi:histidine triad (HIT) family protein
VVPRGNGDRLSFAKGMMVRRDPNREEAGRILREALVKPDDVE